MGKKPKQHHKIVLPPDLPPEIPEDEVEVSDDDLQYVKENPAFASLISTLDTQSITKHVTRVADAKDDALEKLYEQRMQRNALKKEKEETGLQVDRVDALPVKTLDGKVYYRTATKTTPVKVPNEEETGEDENADMGLMKLTKAEKRAKLKKLRKEEKKQGKEVAKEEVEEAPQAAVLDEVKEDLKVEEAFESKKGKLAELGNALLTDPESNIKFLKEMVQISKDNDHTIVKLGLLSLLAVFRDIIPGYRIRLPTEKEQEMKVSKTVKKMRFYESTLLSAYKAYLQKLIALEKQPSFQLVAVRCICSLLDSNPHFNFRETLLDATVRNISSSNETIRQLCCSTIKSLFTNDGKHGGEATVEAVRLISYQVKDRNCQLHPDSIEVFLSLSFEDLGKSEKIDKDQKFKNNKGKKRKNTEASNKLPENDRKKSKQESISKTREEVEADYKAASFTMDDMEKREMQTKTLSSVFETYFRILKHTMQSIVARPEANPGALSAAVAVEPHPLLAPCLKGLAKFSHLIDLDFLGDLMNHLKILASGSTNSSNTSEKLPKCLTVSERLQCCIVAFKVMRTNLDALNVDLQDFTVHLYNLLYEYRPGRDQGEVLAEALKIMLCDDRQHDMQKTAAFIKRLATLSLSVGSADSMAALVTVKHLLLKNVKCRNLLENDTGGGSVSGSIPKYLPYSTDPNLSGALASVLWELSLLSKHYHPAISTMATGISSMTTEQVHVFTKSSPQQAFKDMSLDQELRFEQSGSLKLHNKKRRSNDNATSQSIGSKTITSSFDEDDMRKKISSHFTVLHDIKENERLRSKLDKTTKSLKLYEQYKKQKKQRSKTK